MNWIFAAVLSAVLFATGDFFVVRTESKKISIWIIYLAYSIVIGIASVVLLYATQNKPMEQIQKVGWSMIAWIALLHFFAYIFHFMALESAVNPGYANALVMFHVAVLAFLSWKFLGKPLSARGVVGMLLMFVGAYVVTLQ